MKIFNSLVIPKRYKGSAIAIGNFDGIHVGHQKVFEKTKKFAKKNKIKFGVLTFTPLPTMFFYKDIQNFIQFFSQSTCCCSCNCYGNW